MAAPAGFEAAMARAENEADPSTLSNYRSVAVTSMYMDLTVDFDGKAILGKITYEVEAKDDSGPSELVLDTRGIEVLRAGALADVITGSGVETLFEGADDREPLGRALHVPLGATLSKGDTASCWVEYRTTERSSAVQFLGAEQTADKRAPFLFTQCQAIHARSLLPCQDTPGAKCPYQAAVTLPKGLTAVMSALPDDEAADGDDACDEAPTTTFRFKQPVPVPAYLVALAAGALEQRPLGGEATMSVWAEPSVVDEAAEEFSEIPAFVRAGEELMGPYEWGRYDLLVLPPTFPYGGMENPCMTFVTPTLLAGDKSLADVCAHEICHSWAGNSTGCATWEHFWLNEGATMMAQRLIVAAVSEASSSAHWGELRGDANFHFDAAGGEEAVQEDIEGFVSRGQAPFTVLVPELGGIDPDDVFSRVPYEKGFLLFDAIRRAAGDDTRFRAWFRSWFQDHKQSTATSAELRRHATAFFASPSGDQVPVDLDATIDWPRWFGAEGSAPSSPAGWEDGGLVARCQSLADAWASGKGAGAAGMDGWAAGQRIRFLSAMLKHADAQRAAGRRLPLAIVADLDAAFAFGESRNCEIRFRWLCFRVACSDVLPSPDGASSGCWEDAEAFLRTYGRMKYVRPLFRRLFKDEDARPLAVALAKELATFYHPICAKVVASDVEIETKSPATAAGDLDEAFVESEPADRAAAATASEAGTDAKPETGEAKPADDASAATPSPTSSPATAAAAAATASAAPAITHAKSFAPGSSAGAQTGSGRGQLLAPTRTMVTADLRRAGERAGSGTALSADEAAEAKVLAKRLADAASSEGAGQAEDRQGGLEALLGREIDGPAAEWGPAILAGAAVAAGVLIAVVLVRRATAQ